MSNENKQYRDVTEEDIGKLVEVRDRARDGWILGKLLAIHNGSPVPYECLSRWKYARIAVEEEATATTTSTGKQSHLDADYTLLPPTATRLVAECLAYGERKYGEGNFRRISIKDHLNHAVAHVFEHLSSDNTEDHLIHAATRLLLALEVCSDKDRKYQEPKEVQGE
jgi:hypothetical protein